MSVHDCNVKKVLKTLILLQHKGSTGEGRGSFHNIGRNVTKRQTFKRSEEKAWATLLAGLHSPYVPSNKIEINLHEHDSLESECEVYNELIRKAFFLKLKGRPREGLAIEAGAETLKSKEVNHMLVKFLLCLSNIFDINDERELVFYENGSNDFQLQHNLQLEPTSSKWINFKAEKEKTMQRSFFSFELPSEIQKSCSSIFQDKPGIHFSKSFLNYEEKRCGSEIESKQALFGALVNQHSQSSLEMILSLPEMSTDSASSIFKAQVLSIDEGFIDDMSSLSAQNEEIHNDFHLNDELQIWSDCLASSFQICHTWERLLKHGWQLENYLTESGTEAFDHLQQLRLNETLYITKEVNQTKRFPSEVLMRHSLNVLNGLPSEVFIFSKARCCFSVPSSVVTNGLSSEATQSMLQKFAEIGTHYRQLNRFTQHHSERLLGVSVGLTLESFVSSLCKYLDLYKSAVLAFQENFPANLMRIWAVIEELGNQMRFLAEICLCSAAFSRTGNAPRPKFPVGLKLISYLFDLCNCNKSTVHYNVLVNLFKDTCIPFLRYISSWIFDGNCNDPYNEFLLEVDEQFLCYRDKHYWTHGYVIKDNRKDVEMFDSQFVEEIYACGKAINLLKQTDKHHYLLRSDLSPPEIEITLSTSRMEKIKVSTETYITRVNGTRRDVLEEKKSKMNEIIEKKKEEIASEKRNYENAIQLISELEENVKKAIQNKKYVELQRLKKQMEDSLEKRKAEKALKLQMDKDFLEKEVDTFERQNEIRKKAREELVSYYEKLTASAVARENRALWKVKRYELHEKRKEFVRKEEVMLEEEISDLKDSEEENSIGYRQRFESDSNMAIVTKSSANDIIDHEKNVEKIDGSEVASNRAAKSREWRAGRNFETNFVHDDIYESSGKKEQENNHENDDENDGEKDAEEFLDDGIKRIGERSTEKGEKFSSQKAFSPAKPENEIASDVKKERRHDCQAKSLIYNDTELVGINSNKKVERKLWDVELKENWEKKLWDIEPVATYQPKTVMEDLLYPDGNKTEVRTLLRSTRGTEPIVKIKELLYHQEAAEEEIDLSIRPLSTSEISYDVAVERYQDDYKAMNLTPQPELLDSLLSKSFFSTKEECEETDAIHTLSLEIILHRSLIAPIQSQIKLVQNAAVEYIMDTLQIGVHFDAFRKYLLLEDGEFGLSLCNQLFEKAFENVLSPRDFCKPAILNNIVSQALQFSLFAHKLELSRQISFSLKWIPDFFKATDVNALDFLQLRYKVPWPCNIVITENCIMKYNKVFNFLVRIKMINWALQKVWHNLKRAGHSDKNGLSSQIRQLQLFRHEMQHFVNNVERYLVNQIIHISWQEFQNDLQNSVQNIDDLHKFHVNYLNRIIFRSLLSKNAAPVLKIITDIFTLILKFHHQLVCTDWKENQDGSWEHPFFHSLSSLFHGFNQYAKFLFKVVSKLIRRGYQNHLDHFLLQVNFNGCFEYNIT